MNNTPQDLCTTPHQHEILRTLKNGANLSRNEIAVAAGWPKGGTTYTRMSHNLASMSAKQLVAVSLSETDGRTQCFCITDNGLKALAMGATVAVAISASKKAPAPTRNLFEFPVYQPSKNAYYRNDGNKHLKTRGIES